MRRQTGPKILLVLVAAVAVVFFVGRGNAGSGASARELVKQGALLLDVRTPGEYAEKHIPDAVNIPVQELESRMAELPRDRPIVVYCRSGHRSARAATMLKTAGYTSVYDLGAMSNW